MADPAHWDAIIGTQGGLSKVESVSCANIMDIASLQTLVTVRSADADAPLDVYVYTNITSAKPVQIFKLTGLVKGDAKMSGYNTVMTAQVDKNSSLNTGKAISAMTPDLFREFQWAEKTGSFVQVAFPGLFPDLTRYQAEQDQAQGSQGENAWKYDALKVAQTLAVQRLKWSPNAQTTVLSGGGSQDVEAVVRVQSTGPDHPTISVTLSRLEGNPNNLWEVIAVTNGPIMSITSPQTGDRVTSPVTVKGTGSAFEGDVGTVFVLDHTYTAIGHGKGVPASNGKTTFTVTVHYTASFPGTQEGVLAFFRYSEADGAIAGAVLMKVLLSA